MDAVPVEATPFGPAGFDAFYDRNLPILYGYLLRLCGGDVEEAQDLCQETWIGLVRHVTDHAGATADTGWLVATARSRYIDRWRRAERLQRKLSLAWAAERATDDAEPAPGDLVDSLDELTPTHRLVLTMRYVDEIAVPDIASEIGRSTTATYSLLARARDELRARAKGPLR